MDNDSKIMFAKMAEHSNLFTAQITVLCFAVEALIIDHPDPEKVRRAFDQMFGQFQAGILASGGATPEALALTKPLIEKLFSSVR